MRRMNFGSLKTKAYILGALLIGLIIILAVLITLYNNNLKEATRKSLLAQEELISLIPNSSLSEGKDVEQASTSLGKTINQVLEEVAEENNSNTTENTVEANVQVEPEAKEPPKKELEFNYPVDGDIVKDYARESLVFSETLQEWTVHNGIDIKAERTTVVKAAENGNVVAIKNDPRYGLTIIVEHEDGFKTIYANLLTTEFVEVGEEVKKGQSLGTVGNSAAFEIADEAHLHFEMMKDNEYVDPKLYLK